MSETLRSGEFIMVTNEFDNETARRQVSNGSQTARPDVWWEKVPARTRTAASSRVIQKEYDRKRVTSANPFRVVDETHSSGLKTRSDLVAQRRERSKNVFSGYDLDGDGYVDNNEIVLGKRLDTNNDGKLDETEKLRALQNPNMLSGLSFGHDKTLTSEHRTIQVNGKIVNTHDFSEVQQDTVAKDYMTKMKNSTQAHKPQTPTRNRSQRMNEELLERRKKNPGFEYVEKPRFKTRSQLRSARQRAFLCERANQATEGSRGTNAGLLSNKINKRRAHYIN